MPPAATPAEPNNANTSSAQAFKVDDVQDKEIPLKFLEVDEERFRLVLSNKRAVSDTQMSGFKVCGLLIDGGS